MVGTEIYWTSFVVDPEIYCTSFVVGTGIYWTYVVGTGIYWTYFLGTWRKNGQLVSRIDRRWGVRRAKEGKMNSS